MILYDFRMILYDFRMISYDLCMILTSRMAIHVGRLWGASVGMNGRLREMPMGVLLGMWQR